ncbi:hypothetical protein [Cohaesibacter gelatinilyticus]|uniref:hypothetical protein n=1 Tax=Cohaesibacter gelatinilyticus TaxID=372072 RepID=UPI000BE42BB4|nr:hypothetical protein [Cohaesibacter gelatinilyticus]
MHDLLISELQDQISTLTGLNTAAILLDGYPASQYQLMPAIHSLHNAMNTCLLTTQASLEKLEQISP